jgi:hypothetical protein
MNGTYEVGTHKAREKVKWSIIISVITFFRNEIIFYLPLFSYKLSVRFSTTTCIVSGCVTYYKLCWGCQICTGHVTIYLIIILSSMWYSCTKLIFINSFVIILPSIWSPCSTKNQTKYKFFIEISVRIYIYIYIYIYLCVCVCACACVCQSFLVLNSC